MTNLAITAADVRIVAIWEMMPDGPVNETVAAGVPVREEATTGKYTQGNGSDTTENQIRGIAVNSAVAGETITPMKKGVLDIGDALSSYSYGVPIYLSDTDGTLANTAGSQSVIVGRVIAAWGNTTADKLLLVDL